MCFRFKYSQSQYRLETKVHIEEDRTKRQRIKRDVLPHVKTMEADYQQQQNKKNKKNEEINQQQQQKKQSKSYSSGVFRR